MKRILTLALVAAFVMGVAGFASAKEVQMKAQFVHNLTWLDEAGDFDKDTADDDSFSANQRVRVYFDYVSSEALNAVLGFEIDTTWGDADNGGALATDGKGNVKVKHAYTNFMVPGTSVSARVGLQPVGFKGAYGSPIFDDDAAGILVSSPITDQVGLTVGWVRALADGAAAPSVTPGHNLNDDIDLFTAILPVQGEGYDVTPYLIYGQMGEDLYNNGTNFTYATGLMNAAAPAAKEVDDPSTIWYGGVNFEVAMFSPITIKGDLIYGSVDADEERYERSGWFMDLGAEYKMDFGTLGLMAMYGTGDDDDAKTDGSGTMPTLNDSGFGPTHFGFTGAQTGGVDSQLAAGDRYDLWAIGAYLADFSFVEDLSHKVIVMYGQGTTEGDLFTHNDANKNGDLDNYFITDEDSFWEVNFDSTYQIYENLAAIVELGYINLDRDDDVWGNDPADDDAYKAAFYLKYDF